MRREINSGQPRKCVRCIGQSVAIARLLRRKIAQKFPLGPNVGATQGAGIWRRRRDRRQQKSRARPINCDLLVWCILASRSLCRGGRQRRPLKLRAGAAPYQESRSPLRNNEPLPKAGIICIVALESITSIAPPLAPDGQVFTVTSTPLLAPSPTTSACLSRALRPTS